MNLRFEPYCYNCEFLDPNVGRFYCDDRIRSVDISCEHALLCRRIYEIGRRDKELEMGKTKEVSLE